MEIPEIEYLYNLRRFGMKLDLSIMTEFAELLGNPQEELNFAHIAGTNGKGSTSALLYSIMKRRHRVGLYTSPHLVRYNERFVINDEEIPTQYIVKFVQRYRPMIEKLAESQRNPTFFEVSTGLALRYFADMRVDFAVMEVGLGGRLDATNIITPDVAAIVTIDRDHTSVLGNTIEKIAREKAGIIKSGVPVVVGEHKKTATMVIKKIADRRGAEYHNIHDECHVSDARYEDFKMRFKLSTPVREYSIETSMLGHHQITNIQVAVRMAELIEENYSISRADIEEGVKTAFWRGRFEIKSKEPLLIFDSAHNPAGAKALARTLKELNITPTILFTMLADKDTERYLRAISRVSKKIVITEVNYHRKSSAEELKGVAEKYFENVVMEKEPCAALEQALQTPPVVACGSIYLLGELESCRR